MSDRIKPDPISSRNLSLGEALRSLPLAAPERDAWATLAAELTPQVRRPARRRHALPVALAAGLLGLAAALLLRMPQPAPTNLATNVATVAPSVASISTNDANVAKAANATSVQNVGETDLIALESRSQALERWLHDTRDAASPLPGQDLAAAAEIENLIGLVDVALAGTSRQQALPLWRRRVNLLEDLTALRYSNYRLAETMLASSAAQAPNRIN